MSRIALHDLSPAFQAQAVAQLHGTPKPRTVKIETARPVSKKRIRQNSAGMNKTEQAYFDKLRLDNWRHIYREPSLPLANGLRYKLDFLVVGRAGEIEGHEVKGRAFSTGIAKLKMAAAVYPWVTFRLVTKRRGGWCVETVLS